MLQVLLAVTVAAAYVVSASPTTTGFSLPDVSSISASGSATSDGHNDQSSDDLSYSIVEVGPGGMVTYSGKVSDLDDLHRAEHR